MCSNREENCSCDLLWYSKSSRNEAIYCRSKESCSHSKESWPVPPPPPTNHTSPPNSMNVRWFWGLRASSKSTPRRPGHCWPCADLVPLEDKSRMWFLESNGHNLIAQSQKQLSQKQCCCLVKRRHFLWNHDFRETVEIKRRCSHIAKEQQENKKRTQYTSIF